MSIENTNGSSRKVIIIGGGLAGFALANALKNRGIPFSVYERNETIDHHRQGWTISLHMCYEYLKRCLPEERFADFGRDNCVNRESNEGGTLFKVIDGSNGQVKVRIEGASYKTYRVSRDRFRRWLLKDIQKDVHWNKTMSHYKEQNGQVTAYFTDGTQDTGDLLAGSDGSLSRVACQLYGGKVKFNQMTRVSDIRGYAILHWVSQNLWENLAETNFQTSSVIGAVGSEDLWAPKKTIRMFYTLNRIDRSRTDTPYEVLSFISVSDPTRKLPLPDPSGSAEVLKMMKGWATSAFSGSQLHRELMTSAPDNTLVHMLTIRERIPCTETLSSDSRVVLLGDAVHPMTMFRGEGANHAIVDAANLADEINHVFNNRKPFDQAIRNYYEEMIPRGAAAVEKSHIASLKAHDKIEEVVKMYEEIGRGLNGIRVKV
ncbi:hypothetical protein BY458DRAFT_508642 [Sporodiniella umbellata]|nr:hypothetical protein BY458DRAFT_508642 [Sporodiniella umbellata]